ncbi:MAG: enoyl-CoA hydratase/isomerase family protein [Actinobacteria bacterium]|jgi:enoyl-CoA hydratase|nr:enoyl-CoA hydratase/isomerase family protein [Actinomycetota bacterium]MDP7550559.1 enoyl-CoA hydratase/isomerase family protein [Acidimicrobiales bacterium]MBT3688162.1 enoyl-CoA hydratase/isomerase family protein [Actinomycetota bacterium]MBT4037583.1 enoyl-CoA hydratase/isomerase family protein [Actinomycetota bacterium]MBT4279384.1 enoyl-CoA hydratase/isomerase family protein [Actinomycetota bacterium]|tara:strand:- start:3303 stop:3953 length:651 start_codon:yes stop_codon:yes gene_type:complete
MATQPLQTEARGDGVNLLTLNRPDRRNALNAELRGLLADTLALLATDDSCRVVVLAGNGPTFCAGFDLDEIRAADSLEDLFAEADAYHHAVHTFPKPIIAVIHGPAVAGGMDLALMCDMRIAGAEAIFGQPQVKAGIPAAFDLVASVVAEPVARDICLTGRLFGAAEALSMGLVNRVADGDDLMESTLALATEIASSPASAAAKAQFLAGQPELFG